MKIIPAEKTLLTKLKTGQKVWVNQKHFSSVKPNEIIMLCHQYDESFSVKVQVRRPFLFFWKLVFIPSQQTHAVQAQPMC